MCPSLIIPLDAYTKKNETMRCINYNDKEKALPDMDGDI